MSMSVRTVTGGSAVNPPSPTPQTDPRGRVDETLPASEAAGSSATDDTPRRAGPDLIYVLPGGISFEVRPSSGIEGTGDSLTDMKRLTHTAEPPR